MKAILRAIKIMLYPHAGYDENGNWPVGDPIGEQEVYKSFCPNCGGLPYRRAERLYCATCNTYLEDAEGSRHKHGI